MNAATATLAGSDEPNRAAEVVLALNGRTFHWAAGLLSTRLRQRATRLYAFCRAVDDLADESASSDAARLALAECAAAVRCGASRHPPYQDMIELMRECGVERAVVLELIAGVSSDLGQVRMRTVAQLLHYCYQVAGTVGLMMCRVLDVREERAAAHAIDLGIAMQITNLCRDVSADAASQRRYLPATLAGDLAPAQLVRPAERLRPALRAAVRSLLELADAYYASGERGLPFLPLEARAAILVAARTYRAIGKRLLDRDCDFWTERVAVGSNAKRALAARLLLSRPLTPGFWLPPRRHDARLHLALDGLPWVSLAAETDHVG